MSRRALRTLPDQKGAEGRAKASWLEFELPALPEVGLDVLGSFGAVGKA